ncbi:hypothetical protein C1S86_11760 [Vibrio parahaemolyticus]|uniref:DUF6161 domain-containing protein n=1 Tax=Vibrio parahaemolyticus TaxID=670 RepID=UPI0009930B18|nr:DUF6161 domain-containing protein [Vibrio parahaemolyticus]OOQ68165.1 hypothetical protein BSR61_20705 [Vibrio parahaemolyticus]PMT76230.1 hypothetical protein C1S97_14705 [Vibrio parahaemolyticus]PMT81767.1 hypothetical protein C1S86_11760 [Vibrio parahaemolyticus]
MPSLEGIAPKEIHNYNFTCRFEDVESFLFFLEREVQAWKMHAEQSSGICETIYVNLKQLLKQCSVFLSATGVSNQERNDLRTRIASLNRDDNSTKVNSVEWIHSENPIVQKLIECSNSLGKQAGVRFFDIIVRNELPRTAATSREAKLGDLFAYNYLLSEHQYQSILQDKTDRIEDIQQRMLMNEHEAQRNIDELISSSREKVEHFQDAFKEHLRLKEPAQYWFESARKYGNSAALWGGVLTCLVLLGVAGFVHFYSKFLMGQELGVSLDTVKGVVLFVTGITVYGFLIRVVSRLLMSTIHLQRDSEERAQLTYFYLSLIKDGAIDEDSRNIVIQSLFSRTETGLITGDSSPTMPTVDVLKNIKLGS